MKWKPLVASWWVGIVSLINSKHTLFLSNHLSKKKKWQGRADFCGDLNFDLFFSIYLYTTYSYLPMNNSSKTILIVVPRSRFLQNKIPLVSESQIDNAIDHPK